MDDHDRPQIYLITPPDFTLSQFPDTLARMLDSVEIACLRLHLATRDDDRIARAADALREVAHGRDVPLVIQDHVLLAQRLGLDGVHLVEGVRNLRKVRKDLGADAIVGAFCGNSRHDGMTAREAGADYVSFGPVDATPLGSGARADPELFAWWSEMIELPVVAEGALLRDSVQTLTPVTDFFGFGEEVWTGDDPAEFLKDLVAAMV